MGRGRAKAKQTKVARRLKYTTTATDLDALRSELSTHPAGTDEDVTGDGLDDDDEQEDEADDDWPADEAESQP